MYVYVMLVSECLVLFYVCNCLFVQCYALPNWTASLCITLTRSFDATLSYVPCCCGDADPEAVLDTSRCSSVCEVCSLNGPEDSPSRGSMFATASATFVEVDSECVFGFSKFHLSYN